MKRLPENNHHLNLQNPDDFLHFWAEDSELLEELETVVSPKRIIAGVDNRFPSGLRKPQDDFEGKGVFGGRCNVNACQKPNSAHYFNTAMQSYYCFHCACSINESNLSLGLFPNLVEVRARKTVPTTVFDAELVGERKCL